MKKSATLLVIIIAVVYSCKKSELSNNLIFSGKIENPSSDTLNILNKNREIVKSIILNKDGTFRDTLNVPEGFYSLKEGKEWTQIYLKPKYDLSLTLNVKEFDESIKYEGAGANENNYLAKKALLEEGFGKLNYYGYYGKLSEKEFLKLTDSLYNVQKNFLEENTNLDKDFFYIESKSLEFGMLDKYSSYEDMHKFVTENEDFKVSENYPDAFENIDLSNEEFLISPNYISYVESYLSKKTREKVNTHDNNVDNTLAYVKTIKKEVKNSLIKEELLYNTGMWQLSRTKKLDSVFNQIKPILTNEKHVTEVTEKYNRLKKTEKGAISPVFEFKDINEKIISLNDLKGKLVYIDIWATWCLPCIKEIPDLKKMEAYFEGKDIQFVSICKDDTKDRWKKMVEEKELGGIQLFASNEKMTFFEDYSVHGIPRFILIDKNGKIIDGNAKRPSNPELQQEIEKYL
ncbi:TlpA disulfide reductase family protein [Aquimarina sp. RZ0]|uniref:TlpA family protein disulfide reductase n=1 Tax=Aquimarina sp. RZ0 TaxID=2607730 RepID=UPI0011F274C2|nr:TlpA disulfide reductase family protein [Aquimarina sp. RZ0]KAA1246608.1 TlpA family protein disulfide reductase [Aquimarina sp. RZ0]